MSRLADHRLVLSRALWTASAFAGAMLATPAEAQSSQQLDVYGYVAPRCWASSATAQPGADGTLVLPRAICNQAPPVTKSRMRAVEADGSFSAQMIPVAYSSQQTVRQQTARGALEIVVSPHV